MASGRRIGPIESGLKKQANDKFAGTNNLSEPGNPTNFSATRMTPTFSETLVAAFRGPTSYSDQPEIHRLVEQALGSLNLPADFIRAGDRIVLKPNWVKEHDERMPGAGHWEHVVTHPAVIEAVCRWVAERLRGTGAITICDAPQTDSSFRKLREYCDLDSIVSRCMRDFPGVKVTILDLRPEEWRSIDGVVVSKHVQDGDPLGSTAVSLNEASEFVDFSGQGKLYGASFDMQETNERHNGNRHEYMLCRTPMEADVFINLPKLKTHKKVGLTCALKNLVGINANKNWLPHHTEGTPEQGGDQFPKATRKARLEHAWMGTAKRWLKNSPALSTLFVPLKKAGRLYFGDTQKVIRSGNWHGNDTCWRMVLDLNKCFFFYGGDGQARKTSMRYLAVVDGIIGGEGNGPMSPDPVPAGVILAGTNPVAVDVAAATLMGFDWTKIRMLKHAFQIRRKNFVSFSADDVRLVSNHPDWSGALDAIKGVLNFKPHFGWAGAIEASSSTKLEHDLAVH
jgi:uncharacterized protein (DUF362 family)